MAQRDHVISFMVDTAPLYQTQAWLLLHNLRLLDPSGHRRILLHHCGALSPELRRKADDSAADICPVPRYGTGAAAYCNKLQQFDAILASGADHAVLCDTDIGFLIDPCTLSAPDCIRAKQVDVANPPEPLLRTLLERAGLSQAPLDHHPPFRRDLDRGRTLRVNCNGGLYVLPVALLRRLAPVWHTWARFCLDQEPLLGRTAFHSDQLGFALAMIELGLPFAPLDEGDNYPVHFNAAAYAGQDPTPPRVLHYHRRLQADGRLVGPKVAHIAPQISQFNALTAGARAHPDFQALLAQSHAGVSA